MGIHFGNGASDLNTARIRDRLDEQGSVYGQADSFRLYRFRKGAWPSLLMEVVGSSAQYEEVEQRRASRSERRLFGRGSPDMARLAAERRAELAGPRGAADRGSLRTFDDGDTEKAGGDALSRFFKRSLPSPDKTDDETAGRETVKTRDDI
jgi:hypothetical protein